MSNKLLKKIVVVFGCLFVVFSFYVYQIFKTANLQVEKENIVITIEENTSFTQLRQNLFDQKVIHDQVSFSFIAKILKYQGNIKPGKYLIKSNMTNWNAIRMLRAGNQVPVSLTFNNVRTIEDLAGKITKNMMVDSAEFLTLLQDEGISDSYGFDEKTFVGMFIPNSYQVYWTWSSEKIIGKMNQEYKQFWNANRVTKANEIGLDPKEVTTLASIVEAETAKNKERQRVAGVYMNRLKKGMLLQADPTVKFAVGDFTLKRILFRHLEVDSPYNTYLYKGLPPGPINCPSIPSIDAVLNYEKHDYIYFCAKEDFSGYHNFAKTAAGHAKNRRKYINALNSNGVK